MRSTAEHLAHTMAWRNSTSPRGGQPVFHTDEEVINALGPHQTIGSAVALLCADATWVRKTPLELPPADLASPIRSAGGHHTAAGSCICERDRA
jgi:hypothetical protein